MTMATALRPLKARIETAPDSEIVKAGSADLAVTWNGTYRTIGKVTKITANDKGEVFGTLVFHDDNIGKVAQEMYQTNTLDPYLNNSIFGVTITYR